MDLTKIDWAVVMATLISPIVAVLITLWYQGRERIYQRRLAVFTTMMRCRKQRIGAEYVGALNLVPVEFHNSALVLKLYKELMSILEDTGWKNGEDAANRLIGKVEAKSTELLSAMAKRLSIKLEQMDIHGGAYMPSAWLDEQASNMAMREVLLKVLSGQQPISFQFHQSSSLPSTPSPTSMEAGWGELAKALEDKKF